MQLRFSVIFSLAVATMAAAPALAQSKPEGQWLRDTGTARVQIAPCGDRLCGTIVWVRDKDSPSKVGMRVFYDVEPERASVWKGRAFNPENKQDYEGTLTVIGDTLTTTGCILGRLVCTSMYWKRTP